MSKRARRVSTPRGRSNSGHAARRGVRPCRSTPHAEPPRVLPVLAALRSTPSPHPTRCSRHAGERGRVHADVAALDLRNGTVRLVNQDGSSAAGRSRRPSASAPTAFHGARFAFRQRLRTVQGGLRCALVTLRGGSADGRHRHERQLRHLPAGHLAIRHGPLRHGPVRRLHGPRRRLQDRESGTEGFNRLTPRCRQVPDRWRSTERCNHRQPRASPAVRPAPARRSWHRPRRSRLCASAARVPRLLPLRCARYPDYADKCVLHSRVGGQEPACRGLPDHCMHWRPRRPPARSPQLARARTTRSSRSRHEPRIFYPGSDVIELTTRAQPSVDPSAVWPGRSVYLFLGGSMPE